MITSENKELFNKIIAGEEIAAKAVELKTVEDFQKFFAEKGLVLSISDTTEILKGFMEMNSDIFASEELSEESLNQVAGGTSAAGKVVKFVCYGGAILCCVGGVPLAGALLAAMGACVR